MHKYVVSGLRVISQLRLPGTPLTGPLMGGLPVEIEIADPGVAPPDAVAASPILRIAGPTAWFDPPGMRCRIHDGRWISVAPDEGTQPDVAGLLLGPVLAIVCHQRRLLPLHASAVQTDGGCAVFVGRAYAGKSAVAAACCRRGHTLVADDFVVVHFDEHGSPYAFPGTGAVRLGADACRELGLDAGGTATVRTGVDKVSIPVRVADRALPVHHVIVIDAQDRSHGGVDRRQGLDAVSVLVAATWHVQAISAFGNATNHFAQCAAVASRAAIWRWSRPVGIGRLPGALAGLEAAWRAVERGRR